MIRIRTYQDLDTCTPDAERYLVRLSTPGAAMIFLGPTPLDAQAKAQAFVDRERTSAASQGRMGRDRRVARERASS